MKIKQTDLCVSCLRTAHWSAIWLRAAHWRTAHWSAIWLRAAHWSAIWLRAAHWSAIWLCRVTHRSAMRAFIDQARKQQSGCYQSVVTGE